MSGVVDSLLGLASPWGYLLVGVLAGLEAAAFVGLVIPGEAAMLIGGVLAFSGQASLPVMMAAAATGAIVGDSLGYELGRRFGDPLRRSRLGRRIGERRWAQAEVFLRRHGGPAVFFGRFVGVLRALVPFIAGASRMPYRTFLPYNALGGLVWAPGFVYLGYAAGASYKSVERAAGRASLLLGLALVVLAVVALGMRWVIRHPDRVVGPLRAWRARPMVASLERRYSRPLHFLARRFHPATALGLALTAQLAVLGLCGAAFGAVTEDVIAGNEIVRVDSPVSRFLIERREPWLDTAMELVTQLGSAFVVVPVLVLVGVLVARKTRTWRPLWFLTVGLGGATLTYIVIKLLIARPRPQGDALVQALGYAFPSGHTTQATAGWLAAAIVAGWLTRSLAVRVSLLTGAALIAGAVGVSRVYLGVHAPTDVLGGWALGGLWLAGLLVTTHLLDAREDAGVVAPVAPSILPSTKEAT